MANELFHPEHSSVNTLFTEGEKYTIPTYQRPYSWESIGKSDRNNQINNMWKDFYDFHINPDNMDKEYFFGSIVVFKKVGLVQVVDGQQRLTSLMLLLASMKCFLFNIKDNSSADLSTFIDGAIQTFDSLLFNKDGLDLVPTLKLKIERASGFDFDNILNQTIQCKEKDSVLSLIDDKYIDIATRYIDNRDYFLEQLSITFLDDGILTLDKAKEFNEFAKFIRTKVSIVIINTLNFETAYNIFEVMNNRGLPLTAKDLFRNLIINEFDIIGENDPEKKWNYLEDSYIVTNDFLGRFVESRNGIQIQKSFFSELQNYFKNIESIDKEIIVLYDEINIDLKYYTMFVNPNNISNVEIRNKIRFIKLLSHDRYSVNLIISLFRHFDYDGKSNNEILQFLSLYEKIRLHTLLIPNKRFSSSPIYSSIRYLNNNDLEKANKSISLSSSEKKQLKTVINGQIKDNWNAKLLISKYLFIQYATVSDVVEQTLDFNKATLEHICPQKPAKESNWLSFDSKFRKDITYKLGNFTLLTHNMNAKAKNYDFSRKKNEYDKTILHITKELSVLTSITEEYLEKRQTTITDTICKDLKLN
jgi:uncharacterized protein with ParB-like and HNH nuclease domain